MSENDPWGAMQSTSGTSTVRCPACDSTEVDRSIEGLDPFCQECGAVVSAPIEFDEALTDFEPDRDARESWSENHRVTNSTEYQIARAFEYLEELGSRLDVPTSTRERAAEIYADGATETLTDGRSMELFVTACVTVAGQESENPIPASRIADIADVDSDSLRRICRVLRQDLDYGSQPSPPRTYLGGLARDLEIHKATVSVAEELLEAVPAKQLCGKHPGAFAGAALYLAAEGAITQREIATATGVTTETIRLRVKDCREAANGRLASDQPGQDEKKS
ncbi:transcription initiation factor IIB family protein [Halorhabdus tiamatea]|nr:transcription initiation factor IIB family protein [Halorhabdus tiamatea]